MDWLLGVALPRSRCPGTRSLLIVGSPDHYEAPQWGPSRRGASLIADWDLGLLALAGRTTLGHGRWLGTVDWLMAVHSTVPVFGLNASPASPDARTLEPPRLSGGLHQITCQTTEDRGPRRPELRPPGDTTQVSGGAPQRPDPLIAGTGRDHAQAPPKLRPFASASLVKRLECFAA